MKHVQLQLPDELHRQVKIAAAQDGTNIRAMIIALLEQAMADRAADADRALAPTPDPP